MGMTATELRTLGLAKFGANWHVPLAKAIGIGTRHLRKLAAGEVRMDPDIEAKIRRALGPKPAPTPTWPHDEWIVGDGRLDGGARREYLLHARTPRFIARVHDEASNRRLPADTRREHAKSWGVMVIR